MLAHRDRFTAVPWSQHYDVPINYVGHAKKWDQLVIAGDWPPECNGRVLAVASIFRDVENLQAVVMMEKDGVF